MFIELQFPRKENNGAKGNNGKWFITGVGTDTNLFPGALKRCEDGSLKVKVVPDDPDEHEPFYFETEHEAHHFGEAYYSIHGWTYPHTDSSETVTSTVESQVMRFE